MSEETLFEKLGVKYIEKDGIFYPLITLGGEENSTDVGKYGRMWMDYIQKEYPQRYRSLVRFGELHDKVNTNPSSRILLWKCISYGLRRE